MTAQMRSSATVTQNAWLASTRWTMPPSRRAPPFAAGSDALARPVASAASGCMDRPGDEPGYFLRTRLLDRLLGHLAAAAQHQHAVAHGEDVGHAVADQHDGDALVAQASDEVEHLPHLPHRDVAGRLVH